MKKEKTVYVSATIDVVVFDGRDVLTSSGEGGDPFAWVDSNPNSWDF